MVKLFLNVLVGLIFVLSGVALITLLDFTRGTGPGFGVIALHFSAGLFLVMSWLIFHTRTCFKCRRNLALNPTGEIQAPKKISGTHEREWVCKYCGYQVWKKNWRRSWLMAMCQWMIYIIGVLVYTKLKNDFSIPEDFSWGLIVYLYLPLTALFFAPIVHYLIVQTRACEGCGHYAALEKVYITIRGEKRRRKRHISGSSLEAAHDEALWNCKYCRHEAWKSVWYSYQN
jgi:hypothetical protein